LTSSVDANLLVYAHNVSAPEHKIASTFLEKLFRPDSGETVLILHQTIFELFAILTNPIIVSKPNIVEAWKICLYYFSHDSIQTASYESSVFQIVQELFKENHDRGKRFFDLVLAATLKFHGVRRFYSRNEKHFRQYSFLEVINPL
jgi:predicted nucleic acid-binding protein